MKSRRPKYGFIGMLALPILLAGCASEPPEHPPAHDSAQAPGVRLIAHRGGVVGEAYAENSPAALEAAVDRGYWMIEVDVRESSDGRLVVHHDEDFKRFYGDARLVAETPWSEIEQLRATPGGSRPLLFEELCALASGRLRLMLDVKPPDHSEAFFDSLEESLKNSQLLETAYVIGTDQARRRLSGQAVIGVDSAFLREAAQKGQSVKGHYFLFEHGRDLTPEQVAFAQSLGVPVVPSVNIFHYDDLQDHMETAEADIRRLLELNVQEFQIDSPYDAWLR